MMTQASFEQTLQSLLHRKPFQPFVIEFDHGEQCVVGHPDALFYHSGGTGVYFHSDGAINFVDCEGVRQLAELAVKTPA